MRENLLISIRSDMWSFLILQLLLLLSFFTHSNYGDEVYTSTANYTSIFQSNLGQLLLSLPDAGKNDLFFNNKVGEAPNQVYGLALCVNDSNMDSNSCTSCIKNATYNISISCKGSTSAALWYNLCFIRYSNKNFFNYASVDIMASRHSSFDSGEMFMETVTELMYSLANNATSSPKKLAQGNSSYMIPGQNTSIWGLVECTRDLSADQCNKSLGAVVSQFNSTSRGGYVGCRIYGLNFYLRYEVYPFDESPSPALGTNSTTPLPSPPPPPPLEKKKLVAIYATVAGACATMLLLMIICVLFWMRRQRTIPGNKEKGHYDKSKDVRQGTELIMFDFDTLQDATANFSNENKLGQGGFGQVFKGTLENGQEMAVKRMLQISERGIVELKNEIELLVRLKHRNLVQVLGCCMEDNEKLLCYEYLPNGSLDKILSTNDSARRENLDWETRFKIIEGICCGLVYLHDESRFKIIHRDLKASNILLDTSMNAKISDFGIARLFLEDQTHKSTTTLAGTLGYMAPEYLFNGMFSTKSDVFSFGVLILEIVAGRRCRTNLTSLIKFVCEHWSKGEVSEIKDSVLPDTYLDEVTKCIHVGLLCVQENPDQRPSISQVYLMLDRHSTIVLPALPIRTSQLIPISEDSMDVESASCSTEHILEKFNHDHSSLHSQGCSNGSVHSGIGMVKFD